MQIGKDDDVQFSYTLQGQILQKVQDEKDIEVVIDDQLSFKSHMSEKVNKATSMFGLLRSTFQCLIQKMFHVTLQNIGKDSFGLCQGRHHIKLKTS